MKFGGFELSIIRECNFKLDGGAMFGVVPKPLWNKVAPADEQNRVALSCNLLLIETESKRILVETGMGERWEPRDRQRYEINNLVSADTVLSTLGLTNEDIDAVIISHLHFDHAGGATRLVGDRLEPTFPKAQYFVQRGEWEFAHNANSRAKASYRADDFEPLKDHGVLHLIDGDTEVAPGVWARVSGGHTGHHQVVTFESKNESGIYFADLLPTRNHLSPPWVMGYDHFPLASCDVKQKWLTRAAAENWLVVFDHELGVPWGRVALRDNKFEFAPLAEESLQIRAAAGSSL